MKKIFFSLLTLCYSFLLFAQTGTSHAHVTISGYVKNNWTHEGAIGVNVYIESLGVGTATDINGYYELSVPKGTFRISFTSIELETETRFVDALTDIELNVFMKEKQLSLDAVTVFSEGEDARVKSLDVGKNTLDIEKISDLPSFMGEADVVKSLILLPGVSTVGEGTSGFNVRGGSVDQNLILQDQAIIFNPSHIFGFFSVFNPAILDHSTLYKSGVPAQYGGRLSSVLDVSLREGNYQNHHVKGGIGILASKLAVDGPLIEDKLSYVLGGRVSYSDWMLNVAKASELQNSSASFWDTNLKLSWLINDQNKLAYSGYYSQDGFSFASDTAFAWSTFNHSIEYQHIFSEELVSVTNLISGNYEYQIMDEAGLNAFEINSHIRHKGVKSRLVYEPNSSSTFTAGFESILYQFEPGNQKPLGNNSGVTSINLEDEKSLESAVYVEAEFKVTPKLSVRPGIRFSHFINFGPGTDYVFENGGTRSMDRIVDTIHYESAEPIATYYGLEPRINLNYLLSPASSIKLSYNRQRQYLHLISNTAAVTPTDFWKTSNRYITPQVGDQFAIGYFHNFMNNHLEVSVESYYKSASGIVDFKNGAKLLMNEYLESELLAGTSESYGLELMVNKKAGSLTGWVGYTYSRVFRKVDGEYEEDIINNGDPYPANFDKPHDFTMALNHEANPIIKYGLNFTYSTGRPVTVPLGAYNLSNLTNIFNYSLRNQERIPDYHRLDLSMTVKSKPKINRNWEMSWTFAIYNVYARKNAYSVFFENRYQEPPRAYKLSILGGAFPSISLDFKI